MAWHVSFRAGTVISTAVNNRRISGTKKAACKRRKAILRVFSQIRRFIYPLDFMCSLFLSFSNIFNLKRTNFMLLKSNTSFILNKRTNSGANGKRLALNAQREYRSAHFSLLPAGREIEAPIQSTFLRARRSTMQPVVATIKRSRTTGSQHFTAADGGPITINLTARRVSFWPIYA